MVNYGLLAEHSKAKLACITYTEGQGSVMNVKRLKGHSCFKWRMMDCLWNTLKSKIATTITFTDRQVKGHK